MDSNKTIAIAAICLAAVAIALAAYAVVFDHDAGGDASAQGNFTDDQIKDLVEKLKTNGGSIYTANGGFDIKGNSWSFTIKDRVLIAHFSTYNQDYYIPFSSIDYIWVKS